MYKFDRNHQYSLSDFNQPLGMEMNPENRWVKKAAMIPQDEIEDVLITAIENYRKRTGHYPERVLVDQIYRNQKNRAYCKSKKIRISGKALGRPKNNPTPEEKKTAHRDNTDRIEVEIGFSLAKRCFGMGLIRTKLDITPRSSIALSILAMNISNMAKAILLAFFTRSYC